MSLAVKRRAMKMLMAQMQGERGKPKAAPAISPADKPHLGVTITITPGIVSPTDDHDTVEPDDDTDD